MTPENLMKLKNWAVVGVKQEENQYAYMIYRILKEKGYNVFAVNPKASEIDGDKCYPLVEDIEKPIDVVDMVISPAKGIQLLEGIADKGIKYLWLQPGSYDDEFLKEAKRRGLVYVKDCILARLKLKG